jgi:hypothetical protein
MQALPADFAASGARELPGRVIRNGGMNRAPGQTRIGCATVSAKRIRLSLLVKAPDTRPPPDTRIAPGA